MNHGQEIYVVGTILDDGTVRGGTGWGAEFAKLCNKPLHVFDQAHDAWCSWDGSRWAKRTPGNEPVIEHIHFTGTGHARARGERAGRDPGVVRPFVRVDAA